jgi:hypothetical protein
MQQWNGGWLRERGWQRPLEEIRRFLDTWYFCVSTTGHLYVRPLHQTITGREVHAFLRRLNVLGIDHLPRTMTFDFSMTSLSPRRWCKITKTLQRYAEQANAESMVICDERQDGGVVMLMRSIDRTKLLPQV